MIVFQELTTECDNTTQLYASGLEKKEVASLKCRALSTVNNQIQTAFKILKVRNRSELTLKYAERIIGQEIKNIGMTILIIALSFNCSSYRLRIRNTRRNDTQISWQVSELYVLSGTSW